MLLYIFFVKHTVQVHLARAIPIAPHCVRVQLNLADCVSCDVSVLPHLFYDNKNLFTLKYNIYLYCRLQ